jgi:hypothetical protein
MRFGSLSLLLAVGLLGVGGCGGAGTASPGAPATSPPYDTPPPSGNDPVQTQDPTPPAYDTPPTDYQAPDGSSTGGSAGPICPRLCKVVTELQCLSDGQGGDATPITDADCQAQCQDGIDQAQLDEPCLVQTVDLFACLFDNAEGLTCEFFTQAQGGTPNQRQLDQLSQALTTTCSSQYSAYTSCQTQHPPMDMPPDTTPAVCEAPTCRNCADDCARCYCDANPGACMRCGM